MCNSSSLTHHTRTRTHLHTLTHKHTLTHTPTHTYTHLHTLTHTHTHTRTHTHTHTHTHTLTCAHKNRKRRANESWSYMHEIIYLTSFHLSVFSFYPFLICSLQIPSFNYMLPQMKGENCRFLQSYICGGEKGYREENCKRMKVTLARQRTRND